MAMGGKGSRSEWIMGLIMIIIVLAILLIIK